MWPYSHNPGAVKAALNTVGDSLYTKKAATIYVPQRYSEGYLLVMGEAINVVGIFCLVIDDNYAVCIANAIIGITPNAVNRKVINADEYYAFSFNAGDVIIPSLNVVKSGPFVYRIHDEFIGKGKVPEYINYKEHFMHLFDTAQYHGGLNYGVDAAIVELAVASIARSPKDLQEMYSNVYTDNADDPVYIAMDSVSYGATNTLAKLLGSYYSEGVTSALIYQSDRLEPLDKYLRN